MTAPACPARRRHRREHLELRRGRITLHGPDSVALGMTTPIARLGRPVRETGEATLWGMGYTGPTSAREPDLHIEGKGANDIGIAIKGHRQLELNGVGIDLRERGSVAMTIGASARVEGRNVGITASGADSFGLRVRGDGAGRDDKVLCPVPTSVKLANGFIAMTGHNSPAVEIVRAQVSPEDVSITTSEAAASRWATRPASSAWKAGNAAPLSAAPARPWRRGRAATAKRRASISTTCPSTAASHSLLEVGRDHGEEGPALPAHVELSLNGGDAQGRIWGGGPTAPRVNVTLQHAASWQGHTDVGRAVTVESAGTWNVDGNSLVESVVLDQEGSLSRTARRGRNNHRTSTAWISSGISAAREKSRSARIRQAGRPTKSWSAARCAMTSSSRYRTTGKPAEKVTSMDILHSAQGGAANYALPDKAERVFLAGYAFRPA